MFGMDNNIYFGSSTASALADNTWRIGDDMAAGISFEQYDLSGTAWDEHFKVSENGAEVQSDEAFYLGDPATDGTWRMIRSGDDLLHQRRESGTYVTKQTIED